MEDNIDFGLKKEKSAVSGRRAQKSAPVPTSGPVDDVAEDVELGDTRTTPLDGPPAPTKRVGGWGEETTRRRITFLKPSKSKSKTKSKSRRRGLEEETDERLQPQSLDDNTADNDSDNDIPVIPDLEDAPDEDFTAQVAMAPNVAVNKVATYKELDNELLKHAAFLTLGDVDMKLLAKHLSTEMDVREDDGIWDWDRVFTEVTSDILTEHENMTEEEPDK